MTYPTTGPERVADESRAALFARQPEAERLRRLELMDPSVAGELPWHWAFWSRPSQRPPDGSWRTWLILAGRGFGKTRAGAEWVRGVAEHQPAARIALVAATYAEARSVMVEGASGLLAVCPPHARPRFDSSLRRLEWPNGATAHLYSAAEPEGLRGPEHSHAWADEIGKWPAAHLAWDQLAFTLRAGRSPRAVATTTPRPVPLIRQLVADEHTRITRGSTWANRGHLSPDFLRAVARHRGTAIGRQELDGELIEELAGAFWTRAVLDRSRAVTVGEATRIVVAVDPPAGIGGDACGIVVAARDREGRAAVLADATVSGLPPAGWARAAIAAAERHGAGTILAEANQGGEMVRSVLRTAGATRPIRLVHATTGKVARAEPISGLYADGRVRHAAPMPELEDQLCGLTAAGYEGPGRSPDRADALVWALTDLLLSTRGEPSVRVLG